MAALGPGGPRVSVYDGRPPAQDRQVNLFNDIFILGGADSVTLRDGAFIAAGGVSGDGCVDLITPLAPTFFIAPASFRPISRTLSAEIVATSVMPSGSLGSTLSASLCNSART